MRPQPAIQPRDETRTELLASDTNPYGWPLEALIAQIRREFAQQLLALDGQDEKIRRKLVGYHEVIGALWEAEGRYRVLGSHLTSA